jgi:TolB-like protein
MRRLLAVLVAVLGVGSLAMGQATTMPAADQSVKIEQPVKVLVIPFTQIGDNGHAWVGAAIHENLVTQASADPAVQVIAMNQPMQNNSQQDAISTAKGVGAGFVVFGSFQFAGDQLRVNGRVLETTYGQSVATLSATGPIIDLFKIEDTLSGQMTAGLPQPVNNLPTVSYGPEQTAAGQTAQPTDNGQQQVPYYVANSPDTSASSQAPTYVYAPTYSYPTYPAYSGYPNYSYPYYSYPYWGWGGGIVIINGHPCNTWGGGFHTWGGGAHTWGGGVHTWNGGIHGGFNGGFHGGGGVSAFHGGMGGMRMGGMGMGGGMHGGFAGGGGGFGGGGHGR